MTREVFDYLVLFVLGIPVYFIGTVVVSNRRLRKVLESIGAVLMALGLMGLLGVLIF